MYAYERRGKNIRMRWKIDCSIQGAIILSPIECILTIAQMKAIIISSIYFQTFAFQNNLFNIQNHTHSCNILVFGLDPIYLSQKLRILCRKSFLAVGICFKHGSIMERVSLHSWKKEVFI